MEEKPIVDELHYFDCTCSSFDHVIRFTFDAESGDVWLEARLNVFVTWWRRLWIALLYVFGRTRSHYDTTLLRPEDFGRMHDLLDRAQHIVTQKRIKQMYAASQPPTEKASSKE